MKFVYQCAVVACAALWVVMPLAARGEELKELTVPGRYLSAWNIAYADFSRIVDLSEEQKNLINYDESKGPGSN